MTKSLIFTTLVLSTALAVTGCATKGGNVTTKNVRTHAYRMKTMDGTRFANDGAREYNRYHGTQTRDGNVVGLTGNTNVEMSKEIADKLAALPEIKSAHVALMNKNAYVAVVEENYNNGKVTEHSARTHTITPHSTRRLSVTDRGVGPNNPRSYSGYGYHAGTAVPHTGMTGNVTHGMGTLGTNRTPATMPNAVAPTMPHAVTPKPGVTGTPGTTGTVPSGEISDTLKNQVADIVKGMHPGIENVYVSANADLFGRMQNYANDVAAGHPVRGFVNEFSALVERLFPQAAGTGAPGTRPLSRTAPHFYSPANTPTKTAPSYGMAHR